MTTKHNHQPNFHNVASCPRCAELVYGAPQIKVVTMEIGFNACDEITDKRYKQTVKWAQEKYGMDNVEINRLYPEKDSNYDGWVTVRFPIEFPPQYCE